jgi:hypothetical protein
MRRWPNFIRNLFMENKVDKVQLSNEQVVEVCDEIEHQWLYLVMTRAVFNNKHFPHDLDYISPGFYERYEILFKVEILTPGSRNFKLAASGLKSWHNKNYVIRLNGILEKHRIMYSGRFAYKSELMELIYCLRPEMGAHGSGRKPNDSEGRRKLKKATRLINKLFPQPGGKEYDVKTVEDYWLPIDGVLEPMTRQAIQFIRSLIIK